MGAEGDVVSPEYSQLAEASRRALMAWSWALECAVGASVRSPVRVLIPWRMWSSGVTEGVVVDWWHNSTILNNFSALVSCSIIHRQK